MSAISPLGSAPHQAANATPMPTTAAVSATGSHVCAVLRSISVIISPTHRPIARRRSQPCGTRCLHAAGRRREASSPEKQYMRLCARPERKTAVLQGLNRRMIPVWLSGYLWIATRFGSGNSAPERTFCFSCASSSPRGRACWRKWKRPGGLHRAASFVSKMSIPVTICLGTRLIRGR